MPDNGQCTIDLTMLSDEQRERLQDILNSAISNGQIVLLNLTPEEMGELEGVLAAAIAQ